MNALWGGAAARGQVFPSADANDASEEELEAESRTRGERGAHTPASSSQPGWEREKERQREGERERERGRNSS